MIVMMALAVTDLFNCILVAILMRKTFFRLWWIKFVLEEGQDQSLLKEYWTEDSCSASSCNGYVAA